MKPLALAMIAIVSPTVYCICAAAPPEAVPATPVRPFTDTVPLSQMTLWVAGGEVTGTEAEVRFDTHVLLIGERRVTFLAPVSPPLSDSTLLHVYGKVPRVVELIARGARVSDAVDQYLAEFHQLCRDAVGASELSGFAAGLEVLNQSSLIDTIVYANEAHLAVELERNGLPGRDEVSLRPPSPASLALAPPTIEEKAHSLVADLKKIPLYSSHPVLVLVSESGNLQSIVGESRQQALAQIQYVLNGGNLTTLPPGPLAPRSEYIREIARTARP